MDSFWINWNDWEAICNRLNLDPKTTMAEVMAILKAEQEQEREDRDAEETRQELISMARHG